jgi:predicted  nucleic acid-binding Zn-ribbon protein
MEDSLMRLLDVQEVDKVIYELEASKSEYPAEINLLKHEIETTAKSLEQQEQEIQELEQRRRHFEGELELASAELERHQQQLYEIRTNREYDALQLEIEDCKRRINESENEILLAMTSQEEYAQKLEEAKQTFAQMKKDKSSQIAQLTEDLDSIEEKVSTQLHKRKLMAKDITRRALSAYERIRKVKKDTAVVTVLRGACGGCYKRIPPQKAIEIRKNERLISCENCGRILVWDNRSNSS